MSQSVSGIGTYRQRYLPVPVSNPAYAAGDVVGGLLAIDKLSLAAGGGYLEDIILYDKGAVNADLTAYVFDSRPTSILDSASFALSDADLHKLILQGVITNYVTPASGNSYAKLSDYFLPNKLSQLFVAPKLYIYLVAVGTPDYAVGDLAMKVQVKS